MCLCTHARLPPWSEQLGAKLSFESDLNKEIKSTRRARYNNVCVGERESSQSSAQKLTYEPHEKLIDINQVHDTLTHSES